jgi:hypothetical protein
MTEHLTIVDHPLVQHKLSLMRDKDTSTKSFRQLLREISHLLAYEVTRGLPMTTMRIETPLEPMDAPVIDGKKLALVSILRAGNGLLDGILDLIPNARVGFVGLYRDPETLQPVQYYFKVPSELEDRIDHRRRPDAGDRQFFGRRGRPAERGGGEEHPLPLPSGRARGGGAHETGASRRAHRDRRARQSPERSRLYRAGTGRCGRPDVRDEVKRQMAFT